MKKHHLLLLVIGLAIGCSPKTVEQGQQSEDGKYKVSKVYSKFSQLEPHLSAAPDDETVHVVAFWATWCGQCSKEIPELVKLEEKYRDNKNVKILLVNVDDAKRSRFLLPYLKKHNIQGEVVSLTDRDQDAWIRSINPGWMGGLPGTLFFKGDKHRKFYSYPLSLGELERNIGFMQNK